MSYNEERNLRDIIKQNDAVILKNTIAERIIIMQYEYKTKGTCSQKIFFDLEDGKVTKVQFLGGCNGNLKAIAKLVEGMEASRVIELLSGNTCGFKSTSCGDQLACALKAALEEEAAS